MKYVIASDYDGTLCNRGIISPKVAEAIKEFRSDGNLFIVVTGRDYIGGYEVFKNKNEFSFDYLITNNGALACDREGNIIFAETIKGDMLWGKSTLVQELINRCLELTSNPCGIAYEKTRADFYADYLEGKKDKKKKYHSVSMLKNVREFVSANAVCNTPEHAAQVCEIIMEEFGDVLNASQNNCYIDITPKGIDKSAGIERLAEHIGVERDYIWTVGDNYNDMTMIKKYHGCAIRNGVRSLAEAAEYICDDVSDVIKIVLEKKRCEKI